MVGVWRVRGREFVDRRIGGSICLPNREVTGGFLFIWVRQELDVQQIAGITGARVGACVRQNIKDLPRDAPT